MNKAIVIVLGLLLVVNAQNGVNYTVALEQLIDGVYQNVNLPNPTPNAADCLTAADAQTLYGYIQTGLSDAASFNILGLESLIQDIENFQANLSPAEQACLNGTGILSEGEELANAYGVSQEVNSTTFSAQVQKYLLSNMFTLIPKIKTINSDFTAGNYLQAGIAAGALGQTVIAGAEKEAAVVEVEEKVAPKFAKTTKEAVRRMRPVKSYPRPVVEEKAAPKFAKTTKDALRRMRPVKSFPRPVIEEAVPKFARTNKADFEKRRFVRSYPGLTNSNLNIAKTDKLSLLASKFVKSYPRTTEFIAQRFAKTTKSALSNAKKFIKNRF